METPKINWKNLVVAKKGFYWVVRNNNMDKGGLFTTYEKAEQFRQSVLEKLKKTFYRVAIKRIRKLPIKDRKKEYDRICQILNIS